MQISKYVVNGDADEEEIYGDDYAVKAGQVTDEVDYLSKPENKELINSFVEALKKDVEANGMYIPKNNEKIWGISVTYRISSNDGYDDGGYASGLIYIPEAYTNTMKVLEDKGYLNDAYNFLSECETYTYNEKGKYLSGKKIYGGHRGRVAFIRRYVFSVFRLFGIFSIVQAIPDGLSYAFSLVGMALQ